MLRQVSYEKTLYFNVGTKMYFDNKPIKLRITCTTRIKFFETILFEQILLILRKWKFLLILFLQPGEVMRCPVTKFITHATSHICFLILLAAATFRLTESGVTITTTFDIHNPTFESLTKDEKIQSLLKETLRPANTLLTHVQLCIVFWILGTYSCNIFHCSVCMKKFCLEILM